MAGSATPWSSAPAGAAATATADDDRPQFATALRGYERNQVDDYLAQRDKDLAVLRAELADLRAERDRAVAEVDSTGKELRDVRAKSAHLEPAARRTASGSGPRSCCASPSRRPRRSAARRAVSRRTSSRRRAPRPRRTGTRSNRR